MESRRRDAENLEGIAIEGQAFADHRGVAGKITLPESEADIGGRYATTGLVIFATEETPENRLYAEDVKEIAADTETFGVADFPAGCQIELLAGPGGHFGEAL